MPRFTGVGIHDYPFNSSPARISPWAGFFLCITGLCQARVGVVLQGAEDFATRRIRPQAVRAVSSGRGASVPALTHCWHRPQSRRFSLAVFHFGFAKCG